MTRDGQIAELFMVGISSKATPAAAAETVTKAHVSSVVLLGASTAGQQATAAIVEGIRASVPGVLVAVDQEGGAVQHLQGPGFTRIPSAVAQSSMAPAELQSSWQKWGVQLRTAGVRYDLAPVADVVPSAKVTTNRPIGILKRAYGTTPQAAGQSVAAVVSGLRSAGIVSALKHFPGLGEVVGNTDDTSATDTVTTRTSASLDSFRAGVAAGAQSVMISTARYTRIDPDNRGVFSSTIITSLLRGDLGFTGVVISDDLGVAGAVASIAPGERATRFFLAGGDLLLNANPALQPTMTQSVRDLAADNPAFARRVTQSAARVLRLKAAAGGPSCS